MQIKPIKSQRDYLRTLAEIESLMHAEPDTPEGDRLDILATLAEAWESRHDPIAAPEPGHAIRFATEQRGLTPRDLVPFIGSPARVSEVLAGKRPLTLAMIRRLHRSLGIPAEVLIQEVPNKSAA